MKLWLRTLLKLAWGVYFFITSLYCLLAFLPYTFYALIKSPAYAWMPWFVRHQGGLYWLAFAAGVAAYWRRNDRKRKEQERRYFAVRLGVAAAGVYVTLQPFLSSLKNDSAAYGWSLVALIPIAALATESLWQSQDRVRRRDLQTQRAQPERSGDVGRQDSGLYSYSYGLLIAVVITLVHAVGARFTTYGETHSLAIHSSDLELTFWSLLAHLALAFVILSVLNLVRLVAARTHHPHWLRRGLLGLLIVAGLWTVLVHFLENAMSFGGRLAHLYAASLALALTLWGFSMVLPFFAGQQSAERGADRSPTRGSQIAAGIVLAAASVFAVAMPSLLGGADGNGLFQSTFTLVFWIVASLCLFRLRLATAQYRAALVLSVLLLSGAIYKGLQASEIFWSRPLGSTDDEIALALEAYGGHDNSFHLAHHILNGTRSEACGDLCRILREYTNVRDVRANVDLQLVENLAPTRNDRPNIFVFVIDSMRPDYLGAYNPRVDYTPNLDAFARDSVVLHNVYTQYAGTSLSEPAIWAGAMLLHSHYPQPFSRFNSLQKMLGADRYREVVSQDEILAEILPPGDGITRLDQDKTLWNQLELCSTLQQEESDLDAHPANQPVFFYTQPKNVHQFARNNVPSPSSQHWPDRPGLNSRITYEVHWVDGCLGQFFGYLKQRGMYDNSIIVVTSDHGDATGEFGRTSHSTSIWPEIVRVPLIIHLPPKLRAQMVYDDRRISTLTDIAPTLYYLLGHRPIRKNPLYGRPLFAETKAELETYPRGDVLLASDVRAVYGILTSDAHYLYVTYDSPAVSYLFDLTQDPNAQHNILTPELKRRYDEEIIELLHEIADYYGYKPGVSSLLASTRR